MPKLGVTIPIVLLFGLLFAAIALYVVYKFTVYTLPCLLGVAAGQFAYATGAGGVGCVAVGLGAALLAFISLRWLYFNAISPVRWLVALAVTLTTAVFAYFQMLAVTKGNVPSELWRQVFCVAGAAVAAMIAFVRLAGPPQMVEGEYE